MARLSTKLRSVAVLTPGAQGISFWCPGCDSPHVVAVGAASWSWDGDVDAPTINPSILVTYDGSDAGEEDAPPSRCHSFVRGGQIEFCGDSTHALTGQAVPLPDWP